MTRAAYAALFHLSFFWLQAQKQKIYFPGFARIVIWCRINLTYI